MTHGPRDNTYEQPLEMSCLRARGQVLRQADKHLPTEPTPGQALAGQPGAVVPGGPLRARRAEPLTLNESLVLLSGCCQMMTVTTEQRTAEPMSMKSAHSSPWARASLPSTVTMQKTMMRMADGEREMHLDHFSTPVDTPGPPKTYRDRGSVSVGSASNEARITSPTVQDKDRCSSLLATPRDKKPQRQQASPGPRIPYREGWAPTYEAA